MKTFEEAVGLVIPELTGLNKAGVAEQSARILAERVRFEEIRREAQSCAAIHDLMYQSMVWVAEEQHTVYQVLFTCFMYGLQIGIEMEKHE